MDPTAKTAHIPLSRPSTSYWRVTARCGISLKAVFRLLCSSRSTLVCHSPRVLRHVTYKGEPLVKGKRVTGFTNGEEEAVQLTHVVPFLVEDELMRLGAIFEKVGNWQPHGVADGRLLAG